MPGSLCDRPACPSASVSTEFWCLPNSEWPQQISACEARGMMADVVVVFRLAGTMVTSWFPLLPRDHPCALMIVELQRPSGQAAPPRRAALQSPGEHLCRRPPTAFGCGSSKVMSRRRQSQKAPTSEKLNKICLHIESALKSCSHTWIHRPRLAQRQA